MSETMINCDELQTRVCIAVAAAERLADEGHTEQAAKMREMAPEIAAISCKLSGSDPALVRHLITDLVIWIGILADIRVGEDTAPATNISLSQIFELIGKGHRQ